MYNLLEFWKNWKEHCLFMQRNASNMFQVMHVMQWFLCLSGLYLYYMTAMKCEDNYYILRLTTLCPALPWVQFMNTTHVCRFQIFHQKWMPTPTQHQPGIKRLCSVYRLNRFLVDHSKLCKQVQQKWLVGAAGLALDLDLHIYTLLQRMHPYNSQVKT